jgi:CBS domain-containing membrane protein
MTQSDSRPAWFSFKPILAGASFSDRALACLGAFLGIAAATMAGLGAQQYVAAMPYLFASIGASAVLVFAIPASPLAQPWPVIGGNIVSALVGVAAAQHIGNVYIAGSVAVGVAIFAMSMLRCLHAPGGGTALIPVIGGPAIASLGYSFAFIPVAINAVALVLIGLLFHRFTQHSYPHRPQATAAPAGLLREDIDRAVAGAHETFDIAPADLEALLMKAEAFAERRRGQ